MKAGSLRHRITIQTPGSTRDNLGNRVGYATFAASIPARVSDLSGRELTDAQKVASLVTHSVSIRWLAGVKSKMRVVWGTRVFDIHAVRENDDRRVEHVLLCSEVGNG